jgi:hypothetical protein
MRLCFNCKDRQTFYRLELGLIDKLLLDSMQSYKDQVISLSQEQLSNRRVGAGLFVRYPRWVRRSVECRTRSGIRLLARAI